MTSLATLTDDISSGAAVLFGGCEMLEEHRWDAKADAWLFLRLEKDNCADELLNNDAVTAATSLIRSSLRLSAQWDLGTPFFLCKKLTVTSPFVPTPRWYHLLRRIAPFRLFGFGGANAPGTAGWVRDAFTLHVGVCVCVCVFCIQCHSMTTHDHIRT